MHRSWKLFLVVAAVGILATALAACGGSSGGKATATSSGAAGNVNNSPYQGVLISPVTPKPNFILTDTSGQQFDLQKQTDGYLTLLYLGYTHCPDICPTLMADVEATLKQMKPADAAKVKVVFITTDPERDTPQALRTWLDAFNKNYIGLIPTQTQLNNITSTIGLPPIQKEDLGGGNYAVDHASFVMAFTPNDNKAHIVYPDGVSRDAWAHDLPLLATEGWKGS
jgi:protein SCO1/2